jgi:hypothetical protein
LAASSGSQTASRSGSQGESAHTAPTIDADTPAAADNHLFGVRPGDLLAARYRITRYLGRGGFSQVFQATDQENGETVALKVLTAPKGRRRVVERMRREVRLARDLGHPNITKVHELIEDGHYRFLIMEHVPGRTLKDLIVDEGSLPVTQVYELLRELASAMAAVHAAGIVHRDLKPQNVMVTPAGRVKLLDFGLARATELSGLTVSGEVLGTPEYMSPEQVSGDLAGRRSDVYSMGLIAWEMLVGRPPFAGDKPIVIALQHMQARVPPLSDLCPAVPQAIAQLVLRMTEPTPARRPASAREVLAELERLQPEDLVARPRPSRVRRRLWLAAALLSGALVTALTAVLVRAPAESTDPWADGVIEMTVMPRPVTGVVGGQLFLEAVVSTIEKRLTQPELRVRAVDPAFLDDYERLTMLGFEHLLELNLDWVATEQGRIYRVRAQLIDLSSSDIIWQRTTSNLSILDFAGVEVVSDELLESPFHPPTQTRPPAQRPDPPAHPQASSQSCPAVTVAFAVAGRDPRPPRP